MCVCVCYRVIDLQNHDRCLDNDSFTSPFPIIIPFQISFSGLTELARTFNIRLTRIYSFNIRMESMPYS